MKEKAASILLLAAPECAVMSALQKKMQADKGIRGQRHLEVAGGGEGDGGGSEGGTLGEHGLECGPQGHWCALHGRLVQRSQLPVVVLQIICDRQQLPPRQHLICKRRCTAIQSHHFARL